MQVDKLFVATKGFILKDDQVLLIQESSNYKDGTKVGGFDLPGGRLEPGQSIEEALKREIMEETGLEVEIGQSFFTNESWPQVRGEQWQIIRIFFLCRASSESVVLSEDHSAFKWIDPNSYRSHGVIDNLHPVFEAYLANQA